MRTYQTGKLTGLQADEFVGAFDAAIGTESDTTKYDDDEFIVTCYELTANEVSKCRTIENKINLTTK